MTTILDRILDTKRREIGLAEQRLPLRDIRASLDVAPPVRSLGGTLGKAESAVPRVIAELKKASPSEGVIRPSFTPVSLALTLERNGAAALSVLTDTAYFQGGLNNLRAARRVVGIPVLRKDFIISEYQVYEARAAGADAILLIAAAVDAERFARLHALASQLGMEVLAEAHNHRELDMVLEAGAVIVGINSRDLKTFCTDLDAMADLLRLIPSTCVRVAESGVHDHTDILRLREAGADAFLVGTQLMRARDPGAELAQLLGK